MPVNVINQLANVRARAFDDRALRGVGSIGLYSSSIGRGLVGRIA